MIGKTAGKLMKGFLHLIFRIKVCGLENVPEGGVLVAVNHRSNWDPIIMGAVYPQTLRFMAKSELFKTKLSNWFFRAIGAFPVERGKGDVGAVKTAIKILRNNEPLLIFPEGTRTTDEAGKAKTGAVAIASHAGVSILPVYISGKFRWLSKITVNFGKAIDISEGRSERLTKEQLQEAADKLLLNIRELKV